MVWLFGASLLFFVAAFAAAAMGIIPGFDPKVAVVEEKPAEEVKPPAPALVQKAPAAKPKAQCKDCGVIESVYLRERAGEGTGLGAVGGAIVGGVIGHQVGGGRGKDVATVVGAVGGAYAGNQIEKNSKKTRSFEITVRFEDGTSRPIVQDTEPTWKVGDKVRVENGMILTR
jgi:outer membrane lipoprotein SlyB